MKSPDKIRPTARRAVWSAVIAVATAGALFGARTQAATFTYGNIAVLQEGDGVDPLSTTSAPVAILEFTPSGSLGQTINIPTSGATRLTQSSTSSSEGFITRSTDSQKIVFVGYDATIGISNVPSTSANGTNRCWGQLDVNGNYARGDSGSSTAFTGSNIRSSASDGTSYWMAGTAGASANQGIWYSPSGGTWIQIITSGSIPNTRVTRIYNGKLYYSTSTAISAFTGLPTTAGAPPATTGITGSSVYDFAINSANTVAYVCDDSSLTTVGGIAKWTNSGSGTWGKQFTFGATNGLTAGCRGLAVDFSGAHPVIYATTADTQTKIIEITDTSSSTGPDTFDQAITLAVAPANFAYRGVALAPGSAVTGAPTLTGTGISPAAIANSLGTANTFSVTATGTTPFSYYWYKETATVTNLIPTATSQFLTITNSQLTDSANYQVVVSNSTTLTVTSTVVSLSITTAPPSISAILPLAATSPAGQTVQFTVTASGNPPLGYVWYKETATTTNAIPSANTATLSLTNVLGADAASYQVVVSAAGSSVTATSAVVSLTVTGDPHIAFGPANTYGLVDGTVQFQVGAIGTTPGYQWYFTDGNGNITGSVANGNTTASAVALVSGAASSLLKAANIQPADLVTLTNMIVIVTNVYGSATSSVASLLAVNLTGSALAFWDFNGPEFTNYGVNPNCIYNPTPYLGVGFATTVGSTFFPGNTVTNVLDFSSFSPGSGSVDANNGAGFENVPFFVYPPGFPDHTPPFSWGTANYLPTDTNKSDGVQFNVSTVGAKNIRLSYDSRVSATASDYERVQYTTNGTDWIDYPSSSTFGGVGTTYLSYSNDFTGFPGVANNANFGVRIMAEYESTATYGIGTTNAYVGTANSFGSGGTVTYDVVTFYADAITNANLPPTIAGLVDTNTLDYLPVTNNFTVSDDSTPPDQLTYSAVSLNPSTESPTFVFTGSGANRSLIIMPSLITASVAAAPILVTVTDANGDSTSVSFLLSLTSSNLPPTNSLTSLKATNTLANAALAIPFTVGDDHTPVSALTDFSVASGNNTVIPAANIVLGNTGTAHPTVTITPAHNQLGVGIVSVTLNDDDVLEPKSTTANIPFMVRPNTNIVAIDYFDYDNSPPNALDTVSAGFWTHLSGNFGQLKVGIDAGFGAPNTARVDASANTENLQTALLRAPYMTNSGVTLYASYTINLPDPTKMPLNNGTYVTAFNDGSGATANVDDLLVVSTNNATPGNYRVGIANVVGATALNSVQFQMDLVTSSNYVIVTALSLTNGFSTLWVNPQSQSSPSVTDTTVLGTNFNISEFELRESGQPNGGQVNVGSLKVGTTFDSVFPSLHVQAVGTNAVINWSDPTLGIQATPSLLIPFMDVTGATPPYTNALSTSGTMFFRFGQ